MISLFSGCLDGGNEGATGTTVPLIEPTLIEVKYREYDIWGDLELQLECENGLRWERWDIPLKIVGKEMKLSDRTVAYLNGEILVHLYEKKPVIDYLYYDSTNISKAIQREFANDSAYCQLEIHRFPRIHVIEYMSAYHVRGNKTDVSFYVNGTFDNIPQDDRWRLLYNGTIWQYPDYSFEEARFTFYLPGNWRVLDNFIYDEIQFFEYWFSDLISDIVKKKAEEGWTEDL